MNLLGIIFFIFIIDVTNADSIKFIEKRALQKSHEKPKAVKYMEAFFGKNIEFDQTPSLVKLLNMISKLYLNNCSPVILYDNLVEKSDLLLLEQLFRTTSNLPIDFVHGQISSMYKLKNNILLNTFNNKCVSYILFMADVMKMKNVIGEQNENKIIVVARSSQWRVHEFLASEYSQSFVNLLVIAKSEKVSLRGEELPYILYTHELYTDALGSSTPTVLTSWLQSKLTRPEVHLFPTKMKKGFAGHRFVISLASQPPFVVKRGEDDDDNIKWDGIEVRLVSMLSEIYNFTIDFKEAKEVERLSSSDAVVTEVKNRRANLGIAGIYTTNDRIDEIDVSISHSQDCASFISLTSTALPKYRAIMGPFHWTVWLALTLTYLFAIFPISFSDSHTFKHLLSTPEEMENMFWYVFGTFTNCFTFTGAHTWNKSQKVATRLLIGFYWIFTIITTACYTGSIIAFVTIPVYPVTVDSVKQLLSGRFQVGTLDRGGWERWFDNSSDPATAKLFKNMEYLPNVASGLKNTTKAFFWPYAFLGSQAELDYIVRTNFTTNSRRSVLHISSECFVPFGVSLIFAENSIYTNLLNQGLIRAVQSGFIIKFKHDVEWNIMRSATGKLLQANAGSSLKAWSVEDRSLTLDDTQGMFLLLALGFVIGGGFFMSEWLGGCLNFCKKKRRNSIASSVSIESNRRSHDVPTPREKLDSLKFNRLPFERVFDESGESNTHQEKILINVELNHQKIEENLTPKFNNNQIENEINDSNKIENVEKSSNILTNDELIEEIDKIFNFDEVFGDSYSTSDTCNEEIDSA